MKRTKTHDVHYDGQILTIVRRDDGAVIASADIPADVTGAVVDLLASFKREPVAKEAEPETEPNPTPEPKEKKETASTSSAAKRTRTKKKKEEEPKKENEPV